MIDLSPREKQVLQLLLDGLTRKQTAMVLNVKDQTIQNYRRHLYAKLQVENGYQAVNKGLKLGIIEVMK